MSLLDTIQSKIGKNSSRPPLHLWHPELSGDIDIRIEADGKWFHEGVQIKRSSLVKLFASILRREDDDEYYLLTPVEKWRITVVDTALIVVDIDVLNIGQQDQQIVLTTNVDTKVVVSNEFPLIISFAEGSNEPHPTVSLPNLLTAKLTRPVFYRLVDFADEKDGVLSVLSNGDLFELGSTEG